MISPSQITIDTSDLPQVVQNVIAAIDAAITNWTPFETRKEWSFTWASVGGFTPAKQQAVDKLIAGYRKRGWVCGVAVQSTTGPGGTYVIFFELPT